MQFSTKTNVRFQSQYNRSSSAYPNVFRKSLKFCAFELKSINLLISKCRYVLHEIIRKPACTAELPQNDFSLEKLDLDPQ